MRLTKRLKVNRMKKNCFEDALAVIHTLHGDYGFMAQVFRRDSDKRLHPVEIFSTTAEGFVSRAPHFAAQGYEVFMMVSATDHASSKVDHVTHAYALAVDFDNGVPDLLKSPLLRPSIIIRTSPGRFHALWMLKEKISKEEAAGMLRGMAIRLGADVSFARVNQAIRLPGFVNGKHGTPVELSEMSDLNRIFKPDWLRKALDVDLILNAIRQDNRLFDKALNVKASSVNSNEVVEDVASALPALMSYADNYESWVKLLMAFVALGEKGKELARTFSSYSHKHDDRAFDEKWERLQGSPGEVGTLFICAQMKGWKNPGHRNKESSEMTGLTDRRFGQQVADALKDGYAVTEQAYNGKRQISYFAWNGAAYDAMNDIETRKLVEKVGTEVLAAQLASKAIDSITFKKFTQKLGSNKSLNDIVEHVAEPLLLDCKGRLVDDAPYIGVQNGVVNMYTQQLVPARFRPLPGLIAPVMFDLAAEAPKFKQVVQEIFEGKAEMVSYFYQLIGYALIGNPKEQIFPVFYGPSAGNGKNTLTDTVVSILGPYAVTLPTASILQKSNVNENTTPALARLDGRRLAVVSEPDKKYAMDTGLVKQLTGDRFINVRGLYAANKDMKIKFTLLMLANSIPRVPDDDGGIWRRLRIVPFLKKFEGVGVIKGLTDELLKERSGILNLFLAGALDYLLNDGLTTPAEIMEATQVQQSEVDPVNAFLADCFETGVDEATPLKELYDIVYLPWKKENPSFPPITKRDMSTRLETKGFKKFTKGNLPYFQGLSVTRIPGI